MHTCMIACCMDACAHTRMLACLHVCIACLCMCECLPACMHACLLARIDACLHAWMLAGMHVCLHAWMHACMHGHLHDCELDCLHAHACLLDMLSCIAGGSSQSLWVGLLSSRYQIHMVLHPTCTATLAFAFRTHRPGFSRLRRPCWRFRS